MNNSLYFQSSNMFLMMRFCLRNRSFSRLSGRQLGWNSWLELLPSLLCNVGRTDGRLCLATEYRLLGCCNSWPELLPLTENYESAIQYVHFNSLSVQIYIPILRISARKPEMILSVLTEPQIIEKHYLYRTVTVPYSYLSVSVTVIPSLFSSYLNHIYTLYSNVVQGTKLYYKSCHEFVQTESFTELISHTS